MDLTSLRNILITKKVVFGVVLIIIAVLVVPIIFFQAQKTDETFDKPLPADKQPVKDGKLDIEAPVVQTSKNQVENLKDKLPKSSVVQTKQGTNVTYTLYSKPTDPYSLYIEILGIDFFIPNDSSEYEKTSSDFRDTAAEIMQWLGDNNVDTSSLYIVWGNDSQIQQRAQLWLGI